MFRKGPPSAADLSISRIRGHAHVFLDQQNKFLNYCGAGIYSTTSSANHQKRMTGAPMGAGGNSTWN